MIEANNFELKPSLITMVQHQLTGPPNEDLNEHLGRFLRMENIVKLNGVNLDVIKLRCSHFHRGTQQLICLSPYHMDQSTHGRK